MLLFLVWLLDKEMRNVIVGCSGSCTTGRFLVTSSTYGLATGSAWWTTRTCLVVGSTIVQLHS